MYLCSSLDNQNNDFLEYKWYLKTPCGSSMFLIINCIFCSLDLNWLAKLVINEEGSYLNFFRIWIKFWHPKWSWLSHNLLMTFSWLSHDFLWLSHDFLMPFSWLLHDFLMIFLWISHGFLMTFSCLSQDFLITFLWLTMTLSWISHDFLVTFSMAFQDFFLTFSWLS